MKTNKLPTSLTKLAVAVSLSSALAAPAMAVTIEGSELTIWGYIQADMNYDTGRFDSDNKMSFRPSQILLDDEYDDGGETTATISGSAFGFDVATPLSNGETIQGSFAFDLFTGNDADFHFQEAYIQYTGFLAGKTKTTFMDTGLFPHIMDYWGPNGMVFTRKSQFRYTGDLGEGRSFAVAVEESDGFISSDGYDEDRIGGGDSIDVKDTLPQLAANFRQEGDWGHLHLGGVLSHLELEGTLRGVEYDDTMLGWGLTTSSSINIGEMDSFQISLTYGDGINSYLNDGENTIGEESIGDFDTITAFSGYVAYDHYWSKQWSSALVYSWIDNDTTRNQATTDSETAHYAIANLLYHPADGLTIGLEGQYGEREQVDGEEADNFRMKLAVAYSFDTTFTP